MVSTVINTHYKTHEIQNLRVLCLCISEDTEHTGSKKCSGTFGDFLFNVL